MYLVQVLASLENHEFPEDNNLILYYYCSFIEPDIWSWIENILNSYLWLGSIPSWILHRVFYRVNYVFCILKVIPSILHQLHFKPGQSLLLWINVMVAQACLVENMLTRMLSYHSGRAETETLQSTKEMYLLISTWRIIELLTCMLETYFLWKLQILKVCCCLFYFLNLHPTTVLPPATPHTLLPQPTSFFPLKGEGLLWGVTKNLAH